MRGTYGDARVGNEIGERVSDGKDGQTDDGIRKTKYEPKCLEGRERVFDNELESVTWRTLTTSSAIAMIHTTETRNPMEHLAIWAAGCEPMLENESTSDASMNPPRAVPASSHFMWLLRP